MATNWSKIRATLKPLAAELKKMRPRYHSAVKDYAKLKKESLAKVSRWEWFTNDFYPLEPLHFELSWGLRPGRAVKSGRSNPQAKVGYGFDEDNHIIAMRDFLSGTEEFRIHSEGRIDSALFGRDREVINVQTLLSEDGEPRKLFAVGSGGACAIAYELNDSRITRVLNRHERGEGPYSSDEEPYHRVQEINYKTPGIIRFTTEDEGEKKSTSTYKIPPARDITPKAPMLDLRRDIKPLESLLTKSILKLITLQRGRLKKAPISGFGVTFMYYNQGDGSEIYCYADTREEHEPDGEWDVELPIIPYRRWGEFIDQNEESGYRGTITDVNGNKHLAKPVKHGDSVTSAIGPLLVQVLENLKKKDAFKSLLKTPICEISVEDIDGTFGWPPYAKHGKINRI